MGNSGSVEEEEDEYDKFDGVETLGYRVLGVQPDSPASQAGLVSFLDFLVGVNGKMLLGSGDGLAEGEEYDDIDLPTYLQENLGSELELLVYNIKSQETRFVKLTPSNTWGGAGLLGVTIRLDNYGGADERLIRVLTLEHNSPAAIAGLVTEQDYLLGTVSESLDDTQSLANLLLSHVDQVVEFYVYNTNSDVVRVVPLMPTWSWGGRGVLGAEVGTGYLHRLPHASRSTDGKSVTRKVRYVKNQTATPNPNSANKDEGSNGSSPAPVNLEHEPQLELESEEAGQGVTLVSPEDVSDMTSNQNGVAAATSKIAQQSNPTVQVEDTSEVEAAEGAQDAESLFAGPAP